MRRQGQGMDSGVEGGSEGGTSEATKRAVQGMISRCGGSSGKGLTSPGSPPRGWHRL